MKKFLYKIVCIITVLFVSISFVPISASEIQSDEGVVIHDKYNEIMNHPYSLDMEGNLITSDSGMEIKSVEVVYDGAWYGMRAADVPRVINVSVICKGTGELSNPMYNCTLHVALEFRYNTTTMLITSVGKPDVYSYEAPGKPQNAKNPRATAAITNYGRSVRINGYIDYTAAIYTQTLTGFNTYYL